MVIRHKRPAANTTSDSFVSPIEPQLQTYPTLTMISVVTTQNSVCCLLYVHELILHVHTIIYLGNHIYMYNF